jgi:RNA polymerase sigma factor (sigma-70 family)
MTPLFATKQSPDKAFERLYQAHVHDVYRYALMVLRNPADAEDVAQTTFMNAYRAIQRGEKPRAPRHWLIAIAHNVCRSRLRDASRRPQQVELEEYHVTTAADDDGAEGIDPKELVKALGVLSFNQRSALVMRELEGRSYAEIAELLEVSPTAVETILFRARRALREQLEGTLTCGEAELALSKQIDGRLDADEKRRLRAHLRECKECAGLARRERARSAALRSLGFPLPASLTSWGGGGAAVGTGIAIKAAAIVAASVAAAGVAHQAAEAVSKPASRGRAIVETAVTTENPATLFSFRVTPDQAGRASSVASARKAKHGSTETRPLSAPTLARRARPTDDAGAAADSTPAPAPKLPIAGVPLPVPVPEAPALPVEPPPLPPLPPVTPPEPPPVPVPLPPVQTPTVPSPPEVPPLVP